MGVSGMDDLGQVQTPLPDAQPLAVQHDLMHVQQPTGNRFSNLNVTCVLVSMGFLLLLGA